MPVGNNKRPHSNVMLYTLLTFVGLFILSTAVAVIYYVNFEDQQNIATKAKQDLDELANQKQFSDRGKIVGTKKSSDTYLGKMSEYLDSMVYTIIGGNPEAELSAEVKIKKAQTDCNDIFKSLNKDGLMTGGTIAKVQGLIPTMKMLQSELDNRASQIKAKQDSLDQLNNQYKDSIAIMKERENDLNTQKETYKKQVSDVQADYDNLKTLLSKNSEERVSILVSQLEEAKKSLKETEQNLLKTSAEKITIENRMNQVSDQLAKIVPNPDADVAAFRSDGEIMLLDSASKTVHLNIGSNDHLYRGLTFTIYDKATGIPKDGKGKAEIEVYDVEKNVSVARIIQSDPKNPIVVGDIIANLIWDSKQTNQFVIAGDFDLNGDGLVIGNAQDKISNLIKNWGGTTADQITINTNYLILGTPPKVLTKPTLEQTEIDPMANEKYEKSLTRLAQYNEAKEKANTLRIPIFNYERFLYFIGYKNQAKRPEAF